MGPEVHRFRIRVMWCFALLALLFGLVFCRVCDLGLIRRSFFLAHGLRLSSREGTFTPYRGCICDRSGVKLAWSERFFDLYLASDLPQTVALPRAMNLAKSAVQDLLPAPVPTPDGLLLKRKIPVRELASLQRFLRRYPFFHVRQRIVRMQIGDPRIRAMLGSVRAGHGVSGLEQQHDRLLAGTAGRYRVRLDRSHREIPQTLELLQKPLPGKDLRLPETLQELTR